MTIEQKEWVEKTNLWIQSEENGMKFQLEAIEYSKKQIEIHLETIELNSKLVGLTERAIERVKEEVAKYIAANS